VDYFLSLQALAKASGLSVRKLRSLLADPSAPMPHFRPGGKIVVRWSEFLRYMEHFRAHPGVNIDQAVEAIMTDLRATTRHGEKKAHIEGQPRRRETYHDV
jgi:hypothetical protein